MNHELYISHTKKWLSRFVIAHNICPFAKQEYDNNSIRYHLIESQSVEEQLVALINSCEELDTDVKIETVLLIFPNGINDFDDFLDFLDLANALLEKQAYVGTYQLASFHPEYCFDGVDNDDPSNYTNRSPYPMLHLIRESGLEEALKNYPNPEQIPIRNIEYTRTLGINLLKDLLSDCKTQ